MAPEFKGWTGDFQAYFIGLQLDNSKSYFDAHRDTYRKVLREPLEALLAQLEPEFGPGKIFRPNRDIRFSADKSPYKTNIAADCGGGYLSLDAKGLMTAGGHYMLEGPQVEAFRRAVVDAKSGEELVEIVAELERLGYEVGGQDLKRVPSGYPKDHPRERFLRHKRLYFWRNHGLPKWLATPKAAEKIAEAFRHGRPLDSWFQRHIA